MGNRALTSSPGGFSASLSRPLARMSSLSILFLYSMSLILHGQRKHECSDERSLGHVYFSLKMQPAGTPNSNSRKNFPSSW
eukprot:1142465-Pelagomonas_calceolata.AAC.3